MRVVLLVLFYAISTCAQATNPSPGNLAPHTPGGSVPSVGSHTSAATVASSPGSLTTSSITTNAGGSSFWICAAITDGLTATATDSKGNPYTQIDTAVSLSGLASLVRFKSINGTGGSGHTVTITPSSPSFISIWFAEIKNSTGGVDKHAAQLTNTSPYDSPSVTTTSANEVLLGCGIDDSTGSGDSFTPGLSFISLDQVTNGATSATGISASLTVTSANTYKFETTSAQATQMVVSVDTFK